jgi:cell division control protein 11
MVVGFSGVGKTSFVRTLLESLNIDKSALASDKQKRRDSFMSENSMTITEQTLEGPITKTEAPYTISNEVDVDKEKIVLTLIDTPGFQAEYLVDKQLHDIIKYIEHQFDLTLAEVN